MLSWFYDVLFSYKIELAVFSCIMTNYGEHSEVDKSKFRCYITRNMISSAEPSVVLVLYYDVTNI